MDHKRWNLINFNSESNCNSHHASFRYLASHVDLILARWGGGVSNRYRGGRQSQYFSAKACYKTTVPRLSHSWVAWLTWIPCAGVTYSGGQRRPRCISLFWLPHRLFIYFWAIWFTRVHTQASVPKQLIVLFLFVSARKDLYSMCIIYWNKLKI